MIVKVVDRRAERKLHDLNRAFRFPIIVAGFAHNTLSQHIDRSLQLIREGGCKAGLVFNPATPLHHMDHVMDKLDVILLMSVNPGFGGQKFIPETLNKVKKVRQLIDASGRKTTSDKVMSNSKTKIQLQGNSGIYLIKINSGNQSAIYKVVKK